MISPVHLHGLHEFSKPFRIFYTKIIVIIQKYTLKQNPAEADWLLPTDLHFLLLVSERDEDARHDGVDDRWRLGVALDLGDRRLVEREDLGVDLVALLQLQQQLVGVDELLVQLVLEAVALDKRDRLLEQLDVLVEALAVRIGHRVHQTCDAQPTRIE